MLPAAFGLSDGLTTWVGMVVGNSLVGALDVGTRFAGLAVLAGYGVWLACADDRETAARPPTWLPLVLGLDNLGAGAALVGVTTPLVAAVSLAGVSATMAALGLVAGAAVGRLVPISQARRAAGLMLVTLAVVALAGAG
jgi:putative Mn2+ efflux pump MntP